MHQVTTAAIWTRCHGNLWNMFVANSHKTACYQLCLWSITLIWLSCNSAYGFQRCWKCELAYAIYNIAIQRNAWRQIISYMNSLPNHNAKNVIYASKVPCYPAVSWAWAECVLYRLGILHTVKIKFMSGVLFLSQYVGTLCFNQRPQRTAVSIVYCVIV